ncbi:MAG: glucose-6-phosphate isomerase [Christensenellaceae bacterium]|jgi:glucose-6-phosphate isomerase|nr:glucose-6-phosphate isomerase [Christensenellaceae bacterium]
MENRLKFDFNNMLSQYVGEEGFTPDDLVNLDTLAGKASKSVKESRGKGMMGWTELTSSNTSEIADIIVTANKIKNKFDAFVVLGIGGSALGPMALFQALCHLRHNELPATLRNNVPKFYVEDNVDPERMQSLLDILDLDKTVFNVITKSGSTSETMSQFLIINDILKAKYGSKAAEHMIATTDSKAGNLIKIAQDEGLKTFVIPAGVGGRFSVLSPVGLLPAAVLGIDIKAFLDGAKTMSTKCLLSDSIFNNPALASATLQYASMNRCKNISVMMPYADSLKLMADWYCQLWGESLGKATNNTGKTVNVGQTPVKALGVTDQHSQIQLYVEGPFDKVVTFIGVESYRATVTISGGYDKYPSVAFLSGHTLNELISAEMLATEYALTRNKRPNNKIVLSTVNANTIGQLIMFFMLETAYAGAMLDIDAFNQPGVEEGKNATYALLGRAGYEAKASEINAWPAKDPKYII